MSVSAAIESILLTGSERPRHPVVLETRVRVLRNLPEAFPGCLDDEERQLLRERLFDQVDAVANGGEVTKLRLEDLTSAEREALIELGLTARERPGGTERRGLAFMADPRVSVLLGEKDHLCLQCRHGGWSLDDAYAEVDCLDVEFEDHMNFAFSEEFGYLTASPRRAGTGLDCRLVLHLPALALRGEMAKILRGLAALNVEPSLIGDGEGPGSMLILRNARTFGSSESEILADLDMIVEKLAKLEERARECLVSEAWRLLEDKVWTAFGQLRYGRLVAEEDSDALLGTLRLGCLVGIMQSVDIVEVEEHWLRSRNGSLQIDTGRDLTRAETEALRADRFRKWLAAKDDGAVERITDDER